MTRSIFLALMCACSVVFWGCSGGGSSGGSTGSSGGGGGGNPTPPASEIGTGDHTPSSVTLTPIAVNGISYNDPMDLDFSPSATNELWVVNQGNESIVIFDDVTTTPFTGDKLDSSDEVGSWGHFLSNVSGIAMGANTSTAGNGWTFATSQDSNNGGNNFMGPTLWSADRSVIGVVPNPMPSQWNTSHLDMLHSTTWGKGIAHESANIYWTIGICYDTVVNSNPQVAISKYDFGSDHTPGQDNHVDGQKWHYVTGQVATSAGVHAGMVFDSSSDQLYVCDTGNGRLVRLDTNTGTAGSSPISSFTGDGVDYEVTGATLADVVPTGTLTAPSGLELYNNLLYVADYATGVIHAFDLSGTQVNYLDTGVGANALQGIKIGPAGKLYFCDSKNDQVVRIDP